MILFYFPSDVWFNFDGGARHAFRGYQPPPYKNLSQLDHKRVYVGVREGYESMVKNCRDAGLPPPVQINGDPWQELPRCPIALAEALASKRLPKDRPTRICLINGGGGGLGDGILFAPALEILEERIAKLTLQPPELDVYSGFLKRTSSVLTGIHGVRVKLLPVSLWEVLQYDVLIDFSGILEDEAFQRLHMTDFVLERMGIDHREVPPERKEPLVRLAPPDHSLIGAAVALARSKAGGRPLVALIHRASAPARTMPDEKAAKIVTLLHDNGYMPVIIMPSPRDSQDFLTGNGLGELALDLSPFSNSFRDFMYLLSLMDAIVSVDTSAVHIGAGLRKPTVGIFNAIGKDLRIKYSPSARGIQVDYHGKGCRAPCGLSKIKAFVDIKLSKAGVSRRLLFDYPCDEAVDINDFFDETGRVIAHMENTMRPEDVPGEIEKRYMEWRKRLGGLVAPCWDAFDPGEVLMHLRELEGGDLLFDAQCPVCSSSGPHPRVDRFRGMDRLRCQGCEAVFFPEATKAQGAFPTAFVSQSIPEERSEMDKIAQGFSLLGKVASVDIRDGLDGERRAVSPGCSLRGAVEDGDLDVLITYGCFDYLTEPLGTASRLLGRLRRNGLWIFSITNPHMLRGKKDRDYSWVKRPSPLWGERTVDFFLESLNMRPLFRISTPVTWEDIHEIIGFMPPLNIKPPALKDLTIHLTGQELDHTLASYFQPALGTIRNQGRFLVIGCMKQSEHA